MPSPEFRTVRVFARGPHSGTSVAVWERADDLTPDAMQRLATEIDAPTTAFVQRARRPECEARVRVFSPRRELPLEVAPMLAVAHLRGVTDAAFELGVIAVRVARSGPERFTMRMPRTVLGTIPIEDREAVGSVFGLEEDAIESALPIVSATGGVGALLVPVRTREALSRAALAASLWPLLIEKARVLGVMLYVSAPDGSPVRCRMFAPGAGVAEDAATGSAAAPLAMLLVKHGAATSTVRFHQGRDDDSVSEIDVSVTLNPDGSAEPSVTGETHTPLTPGPSP